jgi:hypothetical protein
MKRSIFLSITLFCFSNIAENIQAAVTFPNGDGADPVWGRDYYIYRDGDDDAVTDETELRAAFAAAGSGLPHIVPVAGDITLSSSISITESKNIVLRKIRKPWNFNNPWINTGAASPDLYDGEPDLPVKISADDYHFKINAQSKLVLENITLDGEKTVGCPGVDRGSMIRHGGIYVNADFDFAGNITQCSAANRRGEPGGAITVNNTRDMQVSISGGVISLSTTSYCGGGISNHWNNTRGTLSINGYTVIENNVARSEDAGYGGGIAAKIKLTLSGNVVIRGNTAYAGGGIMLMNNDAVVINDNVEISSNTSKYHEKTNSASQFSGNGGGIYMTQSNLTVNGNVKIIENFAIRGGGGISADLASSITLNGGFIGRNSALGISREIDATAPPPEVYSIGSGGGIYAFSPQKIAIPASSTVRFEDNFAVFAAYIDNGELQNGNTGADFYAGDSYISHIQNPNIHTSLINTRGVSGQDYYNLYNNYDIGAPNNLSNRLYALIVTNAVPADGAGGNIDRDASNLIYDILGDGRQWAEITHALRYTAVPMPGYDFAGWTVASSVSPTRQEIAALIGLAGDTAQAQIDAKLKEPVLNLTVMPFDINITATFEISANLTVSPPGFAPVELDAVENIRDHAPWPAPQPLAVANTGGKTAHITSAVLTGPNAGYFTLTGGAGTVAAGTTNTASWTIVPNQAAIPNPIPLAAPGTYTVTVLFTYNDGATATANVIFRVVRTPGVLILSSLDFGTYTQGAPVIEQNVLLHNYGMLNGNIADLSIVAAAYDPEAADNDPGAFLNTDGVFEAGQNAIWGNTVSAGNDPIGSNSDNGNWSIRIPAGAPAGVHSLAFAVRYYFNGNQSDIRATTVPATVSIVTPALLTSSGIIFPNTLKEGYSLPPNMISITLQNTGQTPAGIRSAALQTGTKFNLSQNAGDYVPAGGGVNDSYSVAPLMGLSAGTHRDTVIIAYSDGTGTDKTLAVPVTFEVQQADIWNFSLDATGYSFPSTAQHYPIAPERSITVSNTGNQPSGKMKVSFADNPGNAFAIDDGAGGAVSVDNIAAGAGATFRVQPVLGLAIGEYAAQIKVEYDLNGINDDPNDPDDEYSQKSGNYILYTLTFAVVDAKCTWIGGSGQGAARANPDAADHAWSNAANWIPASLPVAVQFIEFDPDAIDLHVNGIYGAASITNETAASLRILKNASLTLTGIVSGKTTALDFTGGGSIHIESGDTTGTNGALIVPKGSNASASFDFYTFATGADTAKTAGEMSWQYFGIPVAQYPAALMDGGFIRKYDETRASGNWGWLTNSDILLPATGYEISRKASQGGFFTISGDLNTDDITLSAFSMTTGSTFPGQHVVSNPYAAGMSIGSGLEFGENMERTVYLFHTGTKDQWEAGSGSLGNAPGQYLAVPQNNAGFGGLPDTLANMQGFVVRVNAGQPADPSKNSLTFSYDHLTQGNTQLRSARATDAKACTAVTLSETDGGAKDRFWLFFDRDATFGYDNGYDGYKIFGESTLARLYAKYDGRSYQVSTQPAVDSTWLFMKAAAGITGYTLTFRHGNLEAHCDNLYLRDMEANITADVTRDGSTYRFTAGNDLSGSQRFLLTTTGSATSIDDAAASTPYLNIYGNHGITVENGYPSPVRVQVYNPQGQLLHMTEVAGRSRETLSANFIPGMYIVRAISGAHARTEMILITDKY